MSTSDKARTERALVKLILRSITVQVPEVDMGAGSHRIPMFVDVFYYDSWMFCPYPCR